MTQKRVWTQQEDQILKHIYLTSGLIKWSHIAKKLQQDYGIKGRNGKQCRQRYITYIDTSHPKDEWNSSLEQQLFKLHNQLGNKWAIIGSKLGGKSDNCVKNRFYSLLRRSLRKINQYIGKFMKKDIKQFKPNILYRIIQISDQVFKTQSKITKEFSVFSNKLKNDLLQFSSQKTMQTTVKQQHIDDYMQDQEDQIQKKLKRQNPQLNQQQKAFARDLIQRITQFNLNYKKKGKRQRRGSIQSLQLSQKIKIQQNQDSHHLSQFLDSNDHTSNLEENIAQQNSDDIVEKTKNSKRTRKNSIQNLPQNFISAGTIRTRARSQGNVFMNLNAIKTSVSNMQVQQQQKNTIIVLKHEGKQMGVEQILQDLNILQSDYRQPERMMLKKNSSRYSHNSEESSDRNGYFLEDSHEIHGNFKHQFNESVQNDIVEENNIFRNFF